MGTTYTLFLIDEFNWGYKDTNKETKLSGFIREWKATEGRTYMEQIGEWYAFAIFDLDKSYPLSDVRKALISKYSDAAYYCTDTSPWNLIKIE